MSSGWPAPHAANDGEASRPLSFIASFVRSAGGKNWSSSNTPSLRIGGCWICPTSVGRSSDAPCDHEYWIRLASRMCSRLDSGSASMPTRPSSPDDVAVDLVADDLGVVGRRHLQRADDVHRHARLRARRVDREVGRRPQRGDLLGPVAPAGEAVAPRRRLLGGEVVGRHAGRLRLGLVDPRPEVGRREVGERQAEVGEVALGVDQQRRQPGPQHLLDEHDAEAGLARSGHADDHAVGREVGRVERDVVAGPLVRGRRRRARRGTAQPCGTTYVTRRRYAFRA